MEQIVFQQPEALYFIIPILLLWFFVRQKNSTVEDLFAPAVWAKIGMNKHSISTKTRLKLLVLSLVLLLVSLSKPVLPSGEITVKKHLSDVLLAVDMSKSMLANDIYPNRFEFTKNKLLNSLDGIKNTRLAVLGFANQAFLVSPLTDDFNSLKFLIKNLYLDNINLTGTRVLNVLQAANDLLEEASNKQILLITDGGDDNDFSEEISYANTHQLEVSVFDVASAQGGVIKDENGIIKDNAGNIVIVKENPNIQSLANNTGGKYLKYSLNNNDLSTFIKTLKRQATRQDVSIQQNQALFYYPLVLAIILLFMAFFSLPESVQAFRTNKQ